MSFIYNAKTLFTGYKLGLKNPSLYIAVPKKHFNTTAALRVNYIGDSRELFMMDVVKERTFNDNFRPGEKYTLCYFLWKKVSKEADND